MTIQTFYRLSLWLPLVVPGLFVLAVNGAGLPPIFPFAILVYSLILGGLPYAAVAIWGTLWIGSRPEGDIRRQALVTPLWTILAYVPIPVLIGVRSGDTGMAVANFVLGAVMIVVLGYCYVLLVFGLREAFFGSANVE